MAEVYYIKSPLATVTNTRAILHGVTYAMSNVTSVRLLTLAPSRVFPIFCIALGLLLTGIGLSNRGLGVFALTLPMMGFGVLLLILRRPAYVVVLGTAGGETHALRSYDAAALRKIVDAISTAIVNRG